MAARCGHPDAFPAVAEHAGRSDSEAAFCTSAFMAWFASDFAIENRVWIRQHLLGLLTRGGGSDHDRARAWHRRLGRRAKRFLSPSQKYEIWLQLVRGETTISEAADRVGVDRSTIMRLRTVAKDGALAALAESRPGLQQARRDLELEAARAEAARLGEALKERPSSSC
jgi:transposase-like protein